MGGPRRGVTKIFPIFKFGLAKKIGFYLGKWRGSTSGIGGGCPLPEVEGEGPLPEVEGAPLPREGSRISYMRR